MDIQAFLRNYWPLLLVGAWFGYKWWRAKKVTGMLPELKSAGAVLIDVRSSGEFAQGNAPGTVNIPLQELGSRLHEIPKAYPVVVGCASGTRSGMAAMLLKRNGYARVHNIGAWTNFMK